MSSRGATMLTRNIGPKVVCKGAGAAAVLLPRSRTQFAVLRARSLVETTAVQPEQPVQPQTHMGKTARYRLQKRAWRMQESEQLLQQADERHLEILASTAEAAALAKQLHVANLQFTATAADVKSFFSNYGTVASVKIFPRGVNSRSLTPSSGRGIVEFTDIASAAQVLQACATDGYLPAATIGHRSHVKVFPARRVHGSSFSQTGADEFTFEMLQLDIGSTFDNATMIVEESIQQTGKLVMSLKDRCLRLMIPIAGVQHQLIAHVRHVRKWLQLTTDGCIVFTLKQPPVVLKAKEDPLASSSSNLFGVSIVGLAALNRRPAMHSSLNWPPLGYDEVEWVLAGDPTAHGAVGSCLSYRLKLSAAGSLPTKLLEQLQSFRLLPRGRTWLRHVASEHLTTIKAVSAYAWQALHGNVQLDVHLQQLPWDVAYQVMRLLTEGVTTKWHVMQPSFMSQLLKAPPRHAAYALEQLAGSKYVLRRPADDLRELLEDMASGEEAADVEEELPAHLCQVSRVHVTPTRVRVQPLERDLTNRIIRHYCSSNKGSDGAGALEASCFMRVGFGDEDGDTMFRRGDIPIEAFYDRMLDVMAKGVTLCGRTFKFLAFSASQLKEQACWMVATDGSSLTPDIMRMWMGDFMTSIRVPAKCAARMGQCFSTTVQAGLVARLEEVPDIERSGYCFSDGVGCISLQLLTSMLARLPYVTVANAPISAIQVRIAGCKGVLSLKPDLPGKCMQVRSSMRKFGSSHSHLEVVNIAQRIPCYLNRQVILLLKHNGVPCQVFLDKQLALLDQLQFIQDDAAKAAKLLTTYGGVQQSARNCMAALLGAHAHVCGRHAPVGQLMSSCLHAMVVYHAHELKAKARLFVDQGATLMGVMDEFGLLQEGEVFVQVQANAESPLTVITGAVMLAKHPVMHPGDVRRANAVSHAQLCDAYVNVAVFSQHGRRPLPNELSGSDLDGDLYSVIWDPQLITKGSNHEAMDYTAPKPTEVGQVTVQHLLEHFVDHARNQNLGIIANAWLGHADQSSPGCSQCLELARLHSMTVDFPKTGVPATMPRELSPRTCPHWIENSTKDAYHSSSVLGQLYDQLQAHPLMKHPHQQPWRQQEQQQQGQAQAGGHASASSTELLGGAGLSKRVAPGYEVYVDAAQLEMERFVDALLSLANRYQSYDLGQLLTGCIIAHTAHQRRRHHDMREQLEHERRALLDSARRAFVVQLLEGAGLAPEHVAVGQESGAHLRMGQAASSSTGAMQAGVEQPGAVQAGAVQTVQQPEDGNDESGAATAAAAVLSAATATASSVKMAVPAADGPSSSSSTMQAPAAAAPAAVKVTATWSDVSLQQLEAVLDRLMPLSPAAIAAGRLSSSNARCQKAAAYHFVAAETAGAAGLEGGTPHGEDTDADAGFDWGDDADGAEDGVVAGAVASSPAAADPLVMARSAFGWVVCKELAAMVVPCAGKRQRAVLYKHFEGLLLDAVVYG